MCQLQSDHCLITDAYKVATFAALNASQAASKKIVKETVKQTTILESNALSIAAVGSKIKDTAQSIGGSVLKIGGSMLKFGGLMLVAEGISLALQGLFNYIDSLYETVEEKKEKLSELRVNFGNSSAELEQIITQLDQLEQRIEELYNKEGITLLEQDELDKLEQASAALKEQELLTAAQNKKDAQQLAEKNLDTFKSDYGNMKQKTPAWKAMHFSADNFTTIKEILPAIEAVDRNIESAARYGNTAVGLNKKRDKLIENLKETDWTTALSELVAYRDTLLASVGQDPSKLTGEYAQMYSQVQDIITSLWSLGDPESFNALGATAEQVKQIQGYLGKVDYKDVIDQFKASYDGENFDEVYEHLFSTDTDLSQYLKKSGISEENFKKYIHSVIDPDSLDLESKISQLLQSIFTNNGWVEGFKNLPQINNWFDSLSDEQIQIAFDLIQTKDTSSWTFADFDAAIKERQDEAIHVQVMAEIKENFTEVSDKVSGLLSAQDTLFSALNEQDLNGSISLDTYQALMDADSGYSDLLERTAGSIRLNADAVKELNTLRKEEALAIIDVQKEADQLEYDRLQANLANLTDAEREQLDILRRNIDSYDMYIAQIEEAYSAFSDFERAKQSSNQGQKQRTMESARDTIQEGLTSKRTGTDDYKMAVQLYVPDIVNPEDAEAVKAYMDSISKYMNGNEESILAFLEEAHVQGLLTKDSLTEDFW